MIHFRETTFAFDGKTVVDRFTLHIARGEHVCLTGESGAGKSTLLGAVVGLALPVAGEIEVDGLRLDASTVQAVRSRVAWVPQEVHLPYETVREAVEAPFHLRVNHGKRLDEGRMLALFDRLGLDRALLGHRMQELSGGEKQRLLLVVACLLDKPILLLDEPTSALDARSRSRLISFLASLDATILAVSHDAELAESFARSVSLAKLRSAL
jgi:ABC-type multidrug transport system ATPase subunit